MMICKNGGMKLGSRLYSEFYQLGLITSWMFLVPGWISTTQGKPRHHILTENLLE